MSIAQTILSNIDRPTSPDHLRALYAEAKAGGHVSYPLVQAAINALADKDCAAKARKAFDALSLNFREQVDLDTLEALANEGRWLAIVRLEHSRTDIWAAAMTAHYGPTGIHESWCNPDGTPSEKCLAECPDVAPRMEEAKRNVLGLIGWYRRVEKRAA